MSGAGRTTERASQVWRRLGPADLAVLLLLALALFAWLAFSQALFNDGDTSWHLAAGRLIIAAGAVPDVDPFSFTFAGSRWTAHEWLAELVMAAAFRIGSWGALALLFAAAVSALVLTLGLELRRWLPARHMIVVLAIVFILLAPSILARPHVLAWPLLAAWTILLIRAREKRRAPPLPAALLMLVWANLHASFIFGLLLIGVFALEALVSEADRRAALLRWGGFGLASLLASLATPHGVHGLAFPLEVSAMKALPLIAEWRPVELGRDWLFLALLAATGLLLLLRRVRVPLVRVILLAALVYLAFQHVRHHSLLAIVGALLLAEPVARAARGETALPRHRDGGMLPLLGAVGIGLVAVAAIRLAIPAEPKSSASNPVAAIASVPPELRGRPVLNSYGFGGPLIFRGIRPFIDGRADMYGDAFIFRHRAIVNGDLAAFRRAADEWGIDWTILAPEAPLVRRLDREAGWRRAYADEWAVVHVATGPPAGRRAIGAAAASFTDRQPSRP